jgi:hypothetical protein
MSNESEFPAQPVTPDAALALLKEGNRRFLEGNPIRPHLTSPERRAALAKEQRPFCVLVGCSDSRVAPEVLFGRGLGDLFIVRNAGNVVDIAAMGSIEFGVTVLGAPLVVVLGHERCGAVQAALDVVEKDASFGRADHPCRTTGQAGWRRRFARPVGAGKRSAGRPASQHDRGAADGTFTQRPAENHRRALRPA